MTIRRRTFLGGAAAGAGLLALRSSKSTSTHQLATDREIPQADDPRVAEVIELSRGRKGGFHVDRVAFVTPEASSGTLPISADEAADLRDVIASRDFTPFQQRGFRIDGKKFVYIREMEDGTVVHAVRRGEFVTVRVTPEHMVIATSVDGMAHPRAVEAVYQYARRTSNVA
jgi:hypothetical protein